MTLAKYNKAIGALVVAAVACLAAFNIEVSEELQAAIITAASGVGTLLWWSNKGA